MKASDLDKKFDAGVEDVIDEFDLSSATRPNREQKRGERRLSRVDGRVARP